MLTLAPTQQDIIEALYTARVATPSQLQALTMPHRQDRAAAWYLGRARADGLATSVRCGRWQEARWHLTPAGYAAAEEWGNVRPRLHRMTMAAGRNVEHALAVNEVAIAFATAARLRGDECGALDCEREVAHPLVARPGKTWRHWVVADAAVRYGMGGGRQLARFVELDRGTETLGRLVEKLRQYVALARVRVAHDHAWQGAYLGAFPKVIVVVGPSSRMPTVEAQRRRATNAAALFAATGDALDVSFCTLAELVERGPWAPIFWRPGDSGAVDVSGVGSGAEVERLHDHG